MKRQIGLMTIILLSALFLAEVPVFSATIATDDGLQLDFSSEGAITGGKIGDLAMSGAGGGFFVADFKRDPARINLLTNPGFEAGTAGWSVSPTSVTIDRTVTHSGSASMRIKGETDSSVAVYQSVSVKPNTPYRVKTWMRINSLSKPWWGFYAREYNARNEAIGPQKSPPTWPKEYSRGAFIPWQDDIWKELVIEFTTSPTTDHLMVLANIFKATGTVWVDDFSVEEVAHNYLPLTGSITGSTPSLRLSAAEATLGLTAGVSITAEAGRIKFDGEITSGTSDDRAIVVDFRVPLNAIGWKWHDELQETRNILDNTGSYQWTNDFVIAGEGKCSIYPLAVLTNGSTGLALALPLAQGPRLFVSGYDSVHKVLFVKFYFGLSNKVDLTHDQRKASFSFALYRVPEPAWGMRSAFARYYSFYAESFQKRPLYEAYMNYAKYEEFEDATHRLKLMYGASYADDPSDFGEGYKFVAPLYAIHGCYHDYRYDVTVDHPAGDVLTIPTDIEVNNFLGQQVEYEKTHPYKYIPASEVVKKIAKNADNEILYIQDTQYSAAHTIYNPTDHPKWFLNLFVNEDPEISGALKKNHEDAALLNSAFISKHPFGGTFTGDAIEGYGGVGEKLDYLAGHILKSDAPLTFGKNNLAPAISNGIYDFHKSFLWPFTNEQKVVVCGNANGYAQGFLLPFVDVGLAESQLWDWPAPSPPSAGYGHVERYMRSMMYHKIWRFMHAFPNGDKDPASIALTFNRGLAYAIFPPVVSLLDYEAFRKDYRRYVAAIEQLSAAGWEPVPYATSGDAEVVVERFGSFAADNLYFSLRNSSTSPPFKTLTVTMDLPSLGILSSDKPALFAYDLLSGNPLELDAINGKINLSLEAAGARAFAITSPAASCRNSLRQAKLGLERIERLFETNLSAAHRAAITSLKNDLDTGLTRPDILALHNDILNKLDILQNNISTVLGTPISSASVDLAKIIFRIKSELSQGTQAWLGVKLDAPRLIENTAKATLRISNAGRAPLTALSAEAITPWADLTVANRAALSLPSALAAGGNYEAEVNFVFPSKPRRLLPFLLKIRGTSSGQDFTLYKPIDVDLVNLYGDLSGDGRVSAYDALLCARIVAGLDPLGDKLAVADVNGDDRVTLIDAALIVERAVGLIINFPVES